MSPLLREYLTLESSMLALDELNAELADRVRDAMDPLWYQLSPEEQAWLNVRELRWDVPHGSISLPLSALTLTEPMLPKPSALPKDPIIHWRRAA